MWASEISPQGYSDFVAIERTCSALSLILCIFIISTFLLSEDFRKPITRLVFFASFGNLFTNVATLMARTFVDVPTSPGCQIQAFLIQMFMPADAYWTLAMAVNVYLTFYRKYDAEMLKRMEMLYLFICYGIPFVVALTYVFIYNPEQGRMYGNALLWCWVSPEWDIWRIATFYAPVWVAIFITFFIYIRTGRQVYRKYKQLRSLSLQPGAPSHNPESIIITEPFSMRTTEVYITSEVIPDAPFNDGTITSDPAALRAPPTTAYSVTITSDTGRSGRSTPQRDHQGGHEESAGGGGGDDDCNDMKSTSSGGTSTEQVVNMNMDHVHSTYRTDSHSHSHSSPAASSLATSGRRLTRRLSEPFRPQSRRQLAVYEANNAAWSYAKCALLFFTALLITWIPSTANRVYSLATHGHVSMGLQYASAFVLPLQGFWNGLIYIFTTRKACAMVIEKSMGRFFFFFFFFSGRKASVPSAGSRRHSRGRRDSFKAELTNRFSSRFGSNSENLTDIIDRQPSRDSDCFMLAAVPGKLHDSPHVGQLANDERG